jgi:hypothetical protein
MKLHKNLLLLCLYFLNVTISHGQVTESNLIKAENEKLAQKMDQLSLTNIQANLIEIAKMRESLEVLKDKSLKNCQKKEFGKDQRKTCLLTLKDEYLKVIDSYYQARLKYLEIIQKHYQNLLGQERKLLIDQLNKETL